MVIDAYTLDGITKLVTQPISSPRDPTTSDKIGTEGTPYPVGQFWVNTTTLAVWSYAGSGNWSLLGSGSVGSMNSITGDVGGAELPLAGNFNILGTANQVLVTGTANTETISLIGPYTPATYTAHGVLIGEGASLIVATTPGTDGQVLTGDTGADPTFENIGVRSGLTAHGVILGEGASAFVATAAGTNGQVLLGSTGADPAFGTLTTTTGVSFTLGAAALAINVSTGGFAVVDQTTDTATLAVQTMYVTNNGATLVTYTLPATAPQGSVIKVIGSSVGGWSIAQNANQQIKLGTSQTTTGITGSLSSTNSNDCVELIASVGGASTIWTIASYSGTLTFV